MENHYFTDIRVICNNNNIKINVVILDTTTPKLNQQASTTDTNTPITTPHLTRTFVVPKLFHYSQSSGLHYFSVKGEGVLT